MQKPENEKSEEMKITQLVATIIMIRLTSNVSRLKMDAGKLFKESSLLRALNLVRAPAGWQTKGFHKQKAMLRCSNDYTLVSSPPLFYLENHVLMFRFEQKQKITTQLCVIIYLALPFLGLCLGFHVFVQDFNDIFQFED